VDEEGDAQSRAGEAGDRRLEDADSVVVCEMSHVDPPL
jgi:hypothetical protein